MPQQKEAEGADRAMTRAESDGTRSKVGRKRTGKPNSLFFH